MSWFNGNEKQSEQQASVHEPEQQHGDRHGAGVQKLQHLMRQAGGALPDPALVTQLLDSSPGERREMMIVIQQTCGNSYVQTLMASARRKSAAESTAKADSDDESSVKGVIQAEPEQHANAQTPEKQGLLKDDDRKKLQMLVEAAIGRAHSAYLSALGSLELERRIERDDELPLWASVLMGAGGKFLEIAFSTAVKSLRAAGAVSRQLGEAGLHGAEHAAGIVGELREKAIDGMIGLSVDAGKEAIKPPAAKAVASDKKGGELGYIDQLKDASMPMFERLATKALDLDDAALVAASKALSSDNIKPSIFREHLAAKIERFMATEVRSIGTRGGDPGFRLERKVAWLHEPGQSEPRLIYVDDAFDSQPGDEGVAYTNLPKLSLGEEGTWTRPQDNMPVGQQQGEVHGHAHQGRTKLVGYVEDEFVEVAKEQMTAVWFEAPKHYRHVLTDGAPRLEPM